MRKSISIIFRNFSSSKDPAERRTINRIMTEELILQKNKEKLQIMNKWWEESKKDSNFENQSKITKEYLDKISIIQQEESRIKLQSRKDDKRLEKEVLEKEYANLTFRGRTYDQEQKQKLNEDDKETKEKSQQISLQCPRDVQIRCLKGNKKDNQAILIGINRSSEEQSIFLSNIFASLKPEIVLTQLPPDYPYLVVNREKEDYKMVWERFLKGDKYTDFLINPNPNYFSDSVFNSDKLELLVEKTFQNSLDYQISPLGLKERIFQDEDAFVIIFQQNPKNFQLYDNLKKPILQAYNTKSKQPLLVSFIGYPELKYRSLLASTVPFQTILNLYKQKMDASQKLQTNFDPLILESEIFIRPKVNYEVQMIKQSMTAYKKVLCVVDNNSVEEIENAWSKVNFEEKPITLKKFLNDEESKLTKLKLTFEQYIRNLVGLDLLISPFINNNFVKYGVVPILGREQMEVSLNTQFAQVLWRTHWEKIKNLKLQNKNYADRATNNLEQ